MGNVLLIGGAGFIGQNLAELLGKNNRIGVVDIHDDYSVNSNNTIYYRADFFRDGINSELLDEYEDIFLLACSVGPKTSTSSPKLCYQEDIIALIDLLEQVKKKKRRVIFISSGGTVYGEHKEKFLSEDMQTYPINHYGIMKLTQEKIILMYNKLYGMNNIIFRLSNPYGCGQRVNSGIGAVTAVLNSVIKNETVHIWGDGTTIRDYIYIKDAVEMISLFLEKKIIKDDLAIYNIGTGVGTSLNELISLAEEITGKKAIVHYEEKRSEDVVRNVLDTSKIRGIIGDYRCINVREGIEKYYREWIE